MLYRIKTIYAAVLTAVGLVSGFFLLAAGCILFVEVICRYSGRPTDWIPEVSVYLFTWAILFGAAYTLMRERHVRVELLTDRLSARARDCCFLLTSLGGTAFCCLVALHGWENLMDALLTGETTATALRIPLWLVDMPLFFGFVLLALQFALQACERLVRLRRGSPAEAPHNAGGGH